jgi:outer membrane protein
MKTKILLFFLILFAAFNLKAQQTNEVSGKKLTLKECVDIALANNLNVKRSIYNVKSFEINYSQAKFALAPNANASVGAGSSWGRSVNPVTNQFITQRNNSLSPNISSSVTLFNGLRLQNVIKQTSRDYQASEADLQKSKNDVILNTITFYLTVILNKELYENAKFQLNSSQQQLERTKKQVEAGSLPRSNELNLDAQVATNELNLINRENAVNLSILQLKQSMQIPASQPLDVEVPVIGIEDLILDQSRDEIFSTAYQAMPEIKSANLKVESSYFAVKAARGNLIPRLTLNGSMNSNYASVNDRARLIPDGGYTLTPTTTPVGYFDFSGTRYPVLGYDIRPTGTMSEGYRYNNQLKDNIYKQVSFSLIIPIFNGLQTRASVQRAVINREVAKITAEQTSNTLRQSVETAYNDAIASSKSYGASLRQVQAREEAFRMTKQRFDIGAATFVEFEVSQNDLFQAKSDLARAKYDFIFRKKVLDFYQGKPIEF